MGFIGKIIARVQNGIDEERTKYARIQELDKRLSKIENLTKTHDLTSYYVPDDIYTYLSNVPSKLLILFRQMIDIIDSMTMDEKECKRRLKSTPLFFIESLDKIDEICATIDFEYLINEIYEIAHRNENTAREDCPKTVYAKDLRDIWYTTPHRLGHSLYTFQGCPAYQFLTKKQMQKDQYLESAYTRFYKNRGKIYPLISAINSIIQIALRYPC